jgi:hypothetical protein
MHNGHPIKIKNGFITENRSTASYDEIAITGFLM